MTAGFEPGGVMLPVPGIRLASASAGIYPRKRPDVVLIEIATGATVSAVFTRNSFCAAPVLVARENLKNTVPRYCLVNAGNANAGTGQRGVENARASCRILAAQVNCHESSVLPFSTGVIGQDLPLAKIENAIPGLLENLSESNWPGCASAIMTTDTVVKGMSRQFTIDGKTVTVTGIAKGSGMIRPDMATMLAYVATDARVEQAVLDHLLIDAVNCSFNRICVDGDMSTNDACVLIASGKAENQQITTTNDDGYSGLRAVVIEVCQYLARAIVRDGEGASKFVLIDVDHGKTVQECLLVAYAVATSPLVKTALFASDPNWGRILAAIGRAGVERLDVNQVSIFLNDVCIVRNGARDNNYTEEAGKQAMSGTDIAVRIHLGRGSAKDSVWTCDLSYDYVRINAEYRS